MKFGKKVVMLVGLVVVCAGIAVASVIVIPYLMDSQDDFAPTLVSQNSMSETDGFSDYWENDTAVNTSSLNLFESSEDNYQGVMALATDPFQALSANLDLDSLADNDDEPILGDQLTGLASDLDFGSNDYLNTPWGESIFGGSNLEEVPLIDTSVSVDDVQFGNPDIQTGTEAEQVNVTNVAAEIVEEDYEPNENEIASAIYNGTFTDLGEGSSDNTVPAPQTSDIWNTVPVLLIGALLAAGIVKLQLVRRDYL